MTISYAKEVANGSSFGCFWKILLKWRGSVYKLVWRELLAYLFLYYSLNFMYRYALNNNQKRVFENIRLYFGSQSESIPMSFVLGFYVSLVVKRWWDQYKLLPWPDTLALYISAGLPGSDERGRLMRRNIVRYAVLAYVITLMRVSLRVKRRFPTWQHVVDSGLMLESEKKIFELMDDKTPMSKYWMPLVWATNIINRARKESLIVSDHIVQTLLVELSDIRRRLGALIGYDTVCVPLVYTQVVTLALYTYFISVLMGRQFVDPPDKSGDNKNTELEYFPFFTVLQFCFYVGWLKVAEVLINPFGEDDDDIELNWLIDRHIKAAYIIVDEMHEEHPELLKDQYWEEVVPKELPYTVASEHYRRHEPKGSAENYKVKEADAMYANLLPNHRKHTAIPDDMYADYESVDTPLVERRKNWFARQITRMGSVRSASTAYSSGGLFGGHRTRHNSVYSSPESGLVPGQHPPVLQHKMSLYDRLVGRKSGRNIMHARQLSRPSIPKLNINGTTLKNRPRIPTPDVTKELVLERDNKLTTTSATIGQGVTLMAHQLATAASGAPPTGYTGYTGNDLPVVQVVLSPIQELQDGSGSRNSTLHAGQPATAALAQAVLASPGLTGHSVQLAATSPQGVTYTPVTVSSMALTPVTMSQLNSLGLTTITSTSEPGNLKNISSISLASPNITFTATNPTISLVSSTRTDTDSDSGTELHTPPPPPSSAPPLPLTITELSEEEAGSESSLTVSNSHEQDRSRKTSVTSQQTNGGGQKRGEVYV